MSREPSREPSTNSAAFPGRGAAAAGHGLPASESVPAPAPYGASAARVLGLLRHAGSAGASRSELAERTGLTPQAVSKITARLRADGLVVEAGRRASTGGKPSTVLRLSPGGRHAVGVQLDRDQLTAVLVDLSGTLVAERTASLDLGAGAEEVLEAVESAVRALVAAGLPGGLRGYAPREAGAVGEAAGDAPGGASGGGDEVRRAAEGEVWSGTGEPGAWEADGAQGSATEEYAAVEGELWTDAGAAPPPRVGPPGAPAASGPPFPAEPAPEPPPAPVPEAGPEPELGTEPEPEPAPGEAPAPAARGAVIGVGVAAPGPLDPARGVLQRVVGFPQWAGYPLRDALSRRLGLPVVLDKDTTAAATGLALHGDAASFAYLHLGTGLGAGVVLGGRVHRGGRDSAGEFGHQVLRLDGPPCRCGKRGCVEVLCLDAVRRGETGEAARVLGVGAANLVSLLDVDYVLLGGRTVLADPDTYVAGVAAEVRLAEETRERGTGAGAPRVGVALAPHGARTVADGAAQLVLAPLFGHAPGDG